MLPSYAKPRMSPYHPRCSVTDVGPIFTEKPPSAPGTSEFPKPAAPKAVAPEVKMDFSSLPQLSLSQLVGRAPVTKPQEKPRQERPVAPAPVSDFEKMIIGSAVVRLFISIFPRC